MGTAIKLLSHVTCSHCWERFAAEQVLWISEHVDLLGDLLLGPECQPRFLPRRFTIDGNDIDIYKYKYFTIRSQNVTCLRFSHAPPSSVFS